MRSGVDFNPQAVIAAFRAMRGRRFNPAQDPSAFADAIAKSKLPLTAERVQRALELL
jgi:hypothetical protein